MTSDGDDDDAGSLLASRPGSAQVEFALVLSRMIDSVRSDPEQLRQAIYELARRKLEEQFTRADVKDVTAARQALETAIEGVEAFARRNPPIAPAPAVPLPSASVLPTPLPTSLPTPSQPEPVTILPGRLPQPAAPTAYESARQLPLAHAPEKRGTPMAKPPKGRGGSLSWLGRLSLLIGLVMICGGLALVGKRDGWTSFWRSQPASAPAVEERSAAPVAAAQPAERPKPNLPQYYGLYAVDDDKLFELELLSVLAPDMRVAVSPTIASESKLTLPNGHPKFIVYRADAASLLAERPEVRVIAHIVRDTSIDAAGKSVVSAGSGWVIRNISVPYRAAPNKDNPTMYDIIPEDPTLELTPGRYALVIKGQAYDFTVAGQVTDLKHCFESFDAANGSFLSECRKL